MKSKILITGASGFVGQNLIQTLKTYYDIFTIDRNSCLLDGVIKNYTIDLKEFDEINQIFDEIKPDVLIHLAAIVHKNNNDVSEENYNLINFECSKHLFDLCEKYEVSKIIFASTIEVYGEQDRLFYDESTDCMPESFYAKSKFKAENYLVTHFSEHSHCKYAILRLCPLYGKSFTLNVDKRVFLKKDKIAYYFKNGNYSFNFLSINNLKLFVKYLCQNKIENEIFILSDDKNVTVKKIISYHKKYNDLKIVIKLPYTICGGLLDIISFFARKAKNRDIYYSRRNFNKLFSSKVYSGAKASSLVKGYTWDIENTLFGDCI